MKIALVHDYLAQNGGAEQVLKILHGLYPTAPIFVLFVDRGRLDPVLASADIHESFLTTYPFVHNHYQWYLPLMPAATEAHDLTDYDIVISSVSAFAKGIITRPDAIHICYCHTPTRYLWSDTHSYVEGLPHNPLIKLLLPPLLSRLRLWDRLAADRVDIFLANSQTVARRIQKYYRRKSEIIYPPVPVADFTISPTGPRDYYLAGGRLVAYKKIDWIIEAFQRLKKPLKIFGEGVAAKKLKKLAEQSSNIEFLGRVSDNQLKKLYAECIAYIHPQVEDFGLTAIEAMASGRPVIALPKGGATETIIENVTGIFIQLEGWEGVFDAVFNFDHTKFNPETIRAHTQQFSTAAFCTKIKALIQNVQSHVVHRCPLS